MIEYRAILKKEISFESGFRLPAGAIIYAEETESGWIGSYYEAKGGSRCFPIDAEDFSIMQSGETGIEYLVVTPDPPEPPEERQQRQELARRRIERRVERLREEADKLERTLLLG